MYELVIFSANASDFFWNDKSFLRSQKVSKNYNKKNVITRLYNTIDFTGLERKRFKDFQVYQD